MWNSLVLLSAFKATHNAKISSIAFHGSPCTLMSLDLVQSPVSKPRPSSASCTLIHLPSFRSAHQLSLFSGQPCGVHVCISTLALWSLILLTQSSLLLIPHRLLASWNNHWLWVNLYLKNDNNDCIILLQGALSCLQAISILLTSGIELSWCLLTLAT
jgi:hypothetical protein